MRIIDPDERRAGRMVRKYSKLVRNAHYPWFFTLSPNQDYCYTSLFAPALLIKWVGKELFAYRGKYRKMYYGAVWWEDISYRADLQSWLPHIHAIIDYRLPPFDVVAVKWIVDNLTLPLWLFTILDHEYPKLLAKPTQYGPSEQGPIWPYMSLSHLFTFHRKAIPKTRQDADCVTRYIGKNKYHAMPMQMAPEYNILFPKGYVRVHPIGTFRPRKRLMPYAHRYFPNPPRSLPGISNGKSYVSSLDRELNHRPQKDAPWRSRQQRLL